MNQCDAMGADTEVGIPRVVILMHDQTLGIRGKQMIIISSTCLAIHNYKHNYVK